MDDAGYNPSFATYLNLIAVNLDALLQDLLHMLGVEIAQAKGSNAPILCDIPDSLEVGWVVVLEKGQLPLIQLHLQLRVQRTNCQWNCSRSILSI